MARVTHEASYKLAIAVIIVDQNNIVAKGSTHQQGGAAALRVGARPRLHAGRLWVCTAPWGRENVLFLVVCTLIGRATDEDLNPFKTEEIWVQPEAARVNVSTDGEIPAMDAPLYYRIHPTRCGFC